MKTKSIVFFVFFCILFSNSRVAFTRPGSMIHIPGSFQYDDSKLVSLSGGAEIVDPSNLLYSFGGSATFHPNPAWDIGFSWVAPVELIPLLGLREWGMHLQRRVFSYNNITFSAGLHDLIYQSDSGFLKTTDISGFGVFTSVSSFDKYFLVTHAGVGSGNIAYDGSSYIEEEQDGYKVAPFFGIELVTPYLEKNGGLRIKGEYDGTGAINIALSIPFASQYKLEIGVTRFQSLNSFGLAEGLTSASDLAFNQPAAIANFSFSIPKFDPDKFNTFDEYNPYAEKKKEEKAKEEASVDSTTYYLLRDSIRICLQEIRNLSNDKILLNKKVGALTDSTRLFFLEKQIGLSIQNKAMRYLSRSLRAFYANDLRTALSEINQAIEISPNLSLAYARRGSIYYKMGDLTRATINWNIALKLDPEFAEIQELLNASKKNLLEPVSLTN